MPGAFQFDAIVAKTEDGVMTFTGVASSTGLDRQQERITEKALEGMASQAPIPLACAGSHDEATVDPRAEVGIISEFNVEGEKLLLRGELDEEHPWSRWLYRGMAQGRWKLSIGGRVPQGSVRTVHDYETGTVIREIDNVVLDHVLLCRANSAVNQDSQIYAATAPSWLEAIAKAGAEWEDPEMPNAFDAPVEISSDEIYNSLCDYLIEKTVENHEEWIDPPWVEELHEDYAIVGTEEDQFYRVAYTVSDGQLEIGEWVPVMREWVVTDPEEVAKAKWSRAYINDLPDSHFLYIEPGGKKDSEGKTVPRSLRHLPYKDANGKIDIPHLRNAIARAPLIKLKDGRRISREKARQIQEKARAILARVTKAEAPVETSPKGDTDMGDPTVIERFLDGLEALVGRLDKAGGAVATGDSVEGDATTEDPTDQTDGDQETPSVEKAISEAFQRFGEQLDSILSRVEELEKTLSAAANTDGDDGEEEEVEKSTDSDTEETAEEDSAEEGIETDKATLVQEVKDIEDVDDDTIARAINALAGASVKMLDRIDNLADVVQKVAEQSNAHEAAILQLQKTAPQSLQAPPHDTEHSQKTAGSSPIQELYEQASAFAGILR